MQDTMKLYKVNFSGLKSCYAVAKSTNEAYRKAKNFYDEKDYGFPKNRELKSVELIAEDYQYTNTGAVLFL